MKDDNSFMLTSAFWLKHFSALEYALSIRTCAFTIPEIYSRATKANIAFIYSQIVFEHILFSCNIQGNSKKRKKIKFCHKLSNVK